MKMIRKFANMTFLLFSVAAIVPAYGNEEILFDSQEVAVESEEIEIVWYKRTETISYAVAAVAAVVYAGAWYKGIVRSPLAVITKMREPMVNKIAKRGDVLNCISREVEKIRSEFNYDAAMCSAYGCQVPETHQTDFVKAIKTVYKKYGISAGVALGEVVDGTAPVYVNYSLQNGTIFTNVTDSYSA